MCVSIFHKVDYYEGILVEGSFGEQQELINDSNINNRTLSPAGYGAGRGRRQRQPAVQTVAHIRPQVSFSDRIHQQGAAEGTLL